MCAHSPIRPFAHSRAYRGFSLIETIVATVILSGAVVALGGISTNVLQQSRLNRHYETAAAVMERQLTLVDVAGIDSFTESQGLEGVYDEAEPGYRWNVETEYKGIDDLYLVTISVEWLEGRKPYRLVAQTMLNGTNSTGSSTTTTTPTPAEGAPGAAGPGGPS